MEGLHRDNLEEKCRSSVWPENTDLPGIQVIQGPSSIESSLRVPFAFCSDCSNQRLTVSSIVHERLNV